jgi:hypothetical protein
MNGCKTASSKEQAALAEIEAALPAERGVPDEKQVKQVK